MNTNKYVIINNRAYDPITGLPVDTINLQTQPTLATVPEVHRTNHRGIATPSVHAHTQHSETLSRRYVKKPSVIAPSTPDIAAAQVASYSPVSLAQMTAKQHAAVQKFTAQTSPAAPVQVDRPAETHPVTQRAHARSLDIASPRHRRSASQQKLDTRAAAAVVAQPVEKKQLKSAHVLKNEAIYAAMQKEAAPEKKSHRAKRKKPAKKWARFTTLATSSLAVVMLAGYFTYLSMPNISLRVAAVQSGVNASYPGYRPDGYALNGPISFKDGEVSMKFAHAGGQDFVIKQQRSNWNSAAVQQFVTSKGVDASTTTVDGLTIYTYDGNAAWVNGGVLYTVEGDALLSSDQLQRIATSL